MNQKTVKPGKYTKENLSIDNPRNEFKTGLTDVRGKSVS